MKAEYKKLWYSCIYPLFFVVIIWFVKLFELSFDLQFFKYGIYPLKIENILGIIISPVIHSDLKHLYSNTIPILVLGTGVFYFYKKIAWNVILLIWFMSGLGVFIGAREAYHIGASGLIYGFASFLFFSGIIRKNRQLTAISFIVIFLYGSIVWGLFPFKKEISFEGHIYGFISGIVFAVFYKNIKTEFEPKHDFWDDDNPTNTTYDYEVFYELENNNVNDSENQQPTTP